MTDRYSGISRLICRGDKRFSYKDAFLFLKNPNLLMRGFALDMPPGFCFVSKYVLPLFANVEFLHLSYGYRLPDGGFPTRGLSKREIVDAALAVIWAHFDFGEEESGEDILRLMPFLSAKGQRQLATIVRLLETEEPSDLLKRAERNKVQLGLNAD